MVASDVAAFGAASCGSADTAAGEGRPVLAEEAEAGVGAGGRPAAADKAAAKPDVVGLLHRVAA